LFETSSWERYNTSEWRSLRVQAGVFLSSKNEIDAIGHKGFRWRGQPVVQGGTVLLVRHYKSVKEVTGLCQEKTLVGHKGPFIDKKERKGV